MSSTIQSGDIQAGEAEPAIVCAGCGESIPIGVARFPSTDGSLHDACRGAVAAPAGALGAVDPGDYIEVKLRGRVLSGTVTRASRIDDDGYLVRVALEAVIPGGIADHIDILTTYLGSDVTGTRWTHPEGFDVIPEWDADTVASDGLGHVPSRSVGPAKIRRA